MPTPTRFGNTNQTLASFKRPILLIADTDSTESEPAKYIDVSECSRVLTHVRFTGTVSSFALTMFYRVGENPEHDNAFWAMASSSDDGTPFTGDQHETRAWGTDNKTDIGFAITTIAGGGTAEVWVEGIE